MKKAVVALINQEGKILVGKKKEVPGKLFSGKWHIPGETVEGNESDQEALIRGMKEEVGIDILVGGYVAEHVSPKGTRVRWYECSSLNYDIEPDSDLDEARWIPKNEVPELCNYASHLWPEEIKKYFGLM